MRNFLLISLAILGIGISYALRGSQNENRGREVEELTGADLSCSEDRDCTYVVYEVDSCDRILKFAAVSRKNRDYDKISSLAAESSRLGPLVRLKAKLFGCPEYTTDITGSAACMANRCAIK